MVHTLVEQPFSPAALLIITEDGKLLRDGMDISELSRSELVAVVEDLVALITLMPVPKRQM